MTYALAACVPAQGPDEPRFGRVSVAFLAAVPTAAKPSPREWRADELRELRAELAALGALGPRFVEDPAIADVDVRPYDAGAGCAAGAGRYRGAGTIELDPACAPGFDALKRALGHELMHHYLVQWFNWRGHICPRPDARADCHPSITAADALLSPGLVAPDLTGPTFEEAYTGNIAFPEPADADLLLVARCVARGRCD